MHIHSPETDNCLSWISGRERMTAEKILTINLHKRMLPTSARVEPATSWSPVGWRIQLSHQGRLSWGGQIVNWLAISNRSPQYLCTYQVRWKSIDIFSSYNPKIKIQTCVRGMTLSKVDEICQLAIPKQISPVSTHIPSLVKIHWHLLKLSSGNILNQISTISMPTPSLVKIQ